MTEAEDSSPDTPPEADPAESDTVESDAPSDTDAADQRQAKSKAEKGGTRRETVILISIAILLYYVTLTFIARPYLIPSESMEPTLHGCPGCVGDRILVDKVSYRFHGPRPGDVIVFKGPPPWNHNYRSIRSTNTALRWVQNALSVVGFVPPDENDLVKRVIAVGGQTVQCRVDTGLTVDGKRLTEPYLDPATLKVDPVQVPCAGTGGTDVEFGPVKVPQGRVWVMGDNRTHSADSRAHCTSKPTDVQQGLYCTGDPMSGTVPVDNVIGKARFIAWPPSRWGGVSSIDPQQDS